MQIVRNGSNQAIFVGLVSIRNNTKFLKCIWDMLIFNLNMDERNI